MLLNNNDVITVITGYQKGTKEKRVVSLQPSKFIKSLPLVLPKGRGKKTVSYKMEQKLTNVHLMRDKKEGGWDVIFKIAIVFEKTNNNEKVGGRSFVTNYYFWIPFQVREKKEKGTAFIIFHPF